MQRFVLASLFVLFSGVNESVAQDPMLDKSGWYHLFDGKTLDGWKLADEPKAFVVEKGLIVAGGTKLTHLF